MTFIVHQKLGSLVLVNTNLENFKENSFYQILPSTQDQFGFFFFFFHSPINHSQNIFQVPVRAQLCTVHGGISKYEVTIPAFQEQTLGGTGLCRVPAMGTSECLTAQILNGQMLHTH